MATKTFKTTVSANGLQPETPQNKQARSGSTNEASETKPIKIRSNIFVPTSVQRKAAPKNKSVATPSTTQTNDQLNHSMNSPFKSIPKRQDSVTPKDSSDDIPFLNTTTS